MASNIFPNDLKDAVHDGKLLPFAGAGVSMAVRCHGQSDPAFPSWKAFLLSGADALDAELLGTDAATVRNLLGTSSPDYLQAAQLIHDGLKPRGWAKLLRRQFALEFTTVDQSTLATAQALWELSPSAIITSNFDLVLRWACPGHRNLREWALDDPHGYIELLDGPLEAPAIWHVHGTVQRPHELVLALDGYQKLYVPASLNNGANRWLAALTTLQTLLVSRTLLFVGFSFADQYFIDQVEHIANVFHGASRIHYVLIKNDANFAATEARLKSLPLRCIPYPDYGQPLIDVIRDLATYRPTPTPGAGGAAGGPTGTGLPTTPPVTNTHSVSAAPVVGAATAGALTTSLAAFRGEFEALLLLGKWTPDSEADRAAAMALGADPTRLERLCTELAVHEDALVRFELERSSRGHWSLTNPTDTWRAFLHSVPNSVLTAFASVAHTILSEFDPALELPVEDRYLAPVRGKVFRHTHALREGVTTNLVRVACSDDILKPTYGTSRGTLLAHGVVRELLRPDWKIWASLDSLLPYLAEAAPSAFLARAEESLAAGDDGIVHLLSEETRFGGAWHTGLLWGLETLGWLPELMSRVAVLLARLSSKDPGGNLANRPVRSLGNMLHPLMPQTRSSAEERIRILRTVTEREPEIGWGVGLALFESTLPPGGVMFSSRRPQIAPWDIPTDADGSTSDAHLEVAELERFLVENANGNEARWSSLLELVLRMSPDAAARTLGAFSNVALSSYQGILGTLRKLISDAHHFGEAWGISNEIVLRLEEQYRHLAPTDPVERVAWLFSKHVQLPEATADWKHERDRVRELQGQAVAEIWIRDDRWKLIDSLAAVVESAGDLGYALADASFADDVETKLLESPASNLARVLPAYVARRYANRGVEWLATAVDAIMRNGATEEALQVLVNIWPDPKVWELIETRAPQLWLNYWKSIGGVFGPLSKAEWTKAISALLDASREALAAETASHAAAEIDAAMAVSVLRALAASRDQLQLFARTGSATYHLERIFEAIDRGGVAVNVEDVIGLELSFLGLLEHSRRSAPHLFSALERTPSLFAQLVVWLYKPSSQSDLAGDDNAPGSLEEGQRAAENAFRVLHAWHGYPGRGESSDSADAAALTWCEHALALTHEAKREEMGAYEVGRVLSRMPPAADGIWPGNAVRVLLKRSDGPKISEGIYIGKRNARGVTTRSMGEGGDQERALAAAFREQSEKLRVEWPETSALLDQLAASYQHEADEQDAVAAADRRRYGGADE